MKCVCTKTCQFRGVTFEGEVREMTAEEFERPFVKAHFRAIAPYGAGAGKTQAADAPDGAGAAGGSAADAAICKTQAAEGAGRAKRAKMAPSLELK